MTLANMAQSGATRVILHCPLPCSTYRVLDVGGYPQDMLVPDTAKGQRCETCGGKVFARPDWSQHNAPHRGRS